MADGYSLAALAGELGVSRQTVYNWTEQHPEFFDAVKAGQAKAVLWWEKANRNLAITGEGNATACVFGLKNRASDDWRDVKATELSGPAGGAIPVQETRRIIVDPKLGDPDS